MGNSGSSVTATYKCKLCFKNVSNVFKTNCKEEFCIQCIWLHVSQSRCEQCQEKNPGDPKEIWELIHTVLLTQKELKAELESSRRSSMQLTDEWAKRLDKLNRDYRSKLDGMEQVNGHLRRLWSTTHNQLGHSKSSQSAADGQLRVNAELSRLKKENQLKTDQIVLLRTDLEHHKKQLALLSRPGPSSSSPSLNSNTGTGFVANSRRGKRRTLAGRNIEELISRLP